MKPKATPGPWQLPHFANPDVACNCRSILAADYAGCIATVAVDNGLPVSKGGNDCPPLEEAIANAHLLRAAPELLVFANAFAELFCDSDMRPEDECHELYTLAEAAIAKATGEKQ